mgnify:CR=1 FL=1
MPAPLRSDTHTERDTHTKRHTPKEVSLSFSCVIVCVRPACMTLAVCLTSMRASVLSAGAGCSHRVSRTKCRQDWVWEVQVQQRFRSPRVHVLARILCVCVCVCVCFVLSVSVSPCSPLHLPESVVVGLCAPTTVMGHLTLCGVCMRLSRAQRTLAQQLTGVQAAVRKQAASQRCDRFLLRIDCCCCCRVVVVVVVVLWELTLFQHSVFVSFSVSALCLYLSLLLSLCVGVDICAGTSVLCVGVHSCCAGVSVPVRGVQTSLGIQCWSLSRCCRSIGGGILQPSQP